MQLFDIPPDLPPGFYYHPDFLSVKEEKDLLAIIGQISLSPFVFHQFEAKRKVKSFGLDYHFDSKDLSKGSEIPRDFYPLINKVSSLLNIPFELFVEVLVTEYGAGTVINWHRDALPFETIAGISLLSDCTFRFRPQEKARQNRKSIISFPLKRRSLYCMKNEARENWQHGIPAVKEKRFSITLRTLKRTWPENSERIKY